MCSSYNPRLAGMRRLRIIELMVGMRIIAADAPNPFTMAQKLVPKCFCRWRHVTQFIPAAQVVGEWITIPDFEQIGSGERKQILQGDRPGEIGMIDLR